MNNLKYFIKLFVFWLIYFLANRLLFIVYYLEEFLQIPNTELLQILPKSFGLDISFVGYASVIITFLLFINSLIISKKVNAFFSGIIFWFNVFLIVVTALIIGGEIALYKEWSTKLNFKALSHFSNPSEVFLTATYANYFTMLICIVIAVVFVKLYEVFVHQNFVSSSYKVKGFIIKLLKLPIQLGILLLIIRGGIKEIPINLSDAYFSNHIIVNDVAVNPNWNIIQSILKNKTNFEGNPYKKYSEEEAEEYMRNIKSKQDSTTYVLNHKSPNIIFILLESWSADNIESFGGLKGVTPNFRALEKEGLSFTDFYSNGWTSDQAMSSIYSSFPAFPYVDIINQSDKSRKLPCLNKSLAPKGYHSSYFFGGQLTYGNIKGYFLSQGFDVVKDEMDYKHLPSGALGVHDEFMFKQFRKELNSLPEPFMSSLFTISSHSPFDFPAEHKLSFNHKDDKFVNSVAYTDRCLGDFIKSVRSEKWYDNTLFIIVADHSHSTPIKRRVAQKEQFRIPMLWLGEVLKDEYKGITNNAIGSQIDIASSVLAQLDIDNKEYIFGNNLFDYTNKIAVPYAFHKGYGLIRPEANYAFSESYNKVFESFAIDSVKEMKIKKEAEIYFQAAFKEYMDL